MTKIKVLYERQEYIDGLFKDVPKVTEFEFEDVNNKESWKQIQKFLVKNEIYIGLNLKQIIFEI